mgnify:FL=1
MTGSRGAVPAEPPFANVPFAIARVPPGGIGERAPIPTPHAAPRAPQPSEPTMKQENETAASPSTREVAAEKPRKPRGFAAMDRRKVSEIASKGGKAAHTAGTAHKFSSDEAKVAGRKGGLAPHKKRGVGSDA